MATKTFTIEIDETQVALLRLALANLTPITIQRAHPITPALQAYDVAGLHNEVIDMLGMLSAGLETDGINSFIL